MTKKIKSSTSSTTLATRAARSMTERIRTSDSSTWMRLRARNSLALFHEVARRVPAYRTFLQNHGVRAESVHSREDFENIPATSKDTYLRKYQLADLCWDGTLARPGVFSSTSGSTGKPFYFQRLSNLEEEYSILAELFLRNGVLTPGTKNPTLVIIGFGMGVWIGGTLTYRAFDIASRRSCPVSILPAGVNKAEILKALHDLAPSFTQTILIGYPPFIKDILDEAELEGINLKALHMRLFFAAEAFSERFRDYLAKKVGMKNIYRDTLNVYGTADIGAMAFETPTAILVRRLATRNRKVCESIFGEIHKMPTLAQYNPSFVSFEAPDGEILLTGYSAMPLVRYAVGDHGGVLSYDEVEARLADAGIHLKKEAKKCGVPIYELPFVFVYARVDLSTKLYGAIIYPEHIRDALEYKTLQRWVTGKFTMQTLSDVSHNQYLEINIELKKEKQPSEQLVKDIQERIISTLILKNSEYHNNYTHLKKKVFPRIVLWSHEDPTYFKPGIKQKWVKK